MNVTLPLGRIAGVRVGLHWSVLVIVALVTVVLAGGRFPDAHPGHSGWAYWAAALLTALVFLTSLLAHELAHAIVAQRNGVRVDGITLWMLGGVARLHSEAPTPRAELRIAGVGPLTSAVAAGAFTGLALGLDGLDAPGLVVEAAAWLAAVNLVLAVFNAVPAAPLDGGRLLRAFLWQRTGDRVRATRGASAAGRALGWFMVLGGFMTVLIASDLSGLWPALIGWFLITTATQEARQAELRNVLADLPVRRVMTDDPVTVRATETLTRFLTEGLSGGYRHSAYPVLSPDGAPAGLVTAALVNRAPVYTRSTTTIADVMRPLPEVETAAPDEPVVDLLPRLRASKDRRALVLDDGRVVGIVTLADISRAVSWLTTANRPGS